MESIGFMVCVCSMRRLEHAWLFVQRPATHTVMIQAVKSGAENGRQVVPSQKILGHSMSPAKPPSPDTTLLKMLVHLHISGNRKMKGLLTDSFAAK